MNDVVKKTDLFEDDLFNKAIEGADDLDLTLKILIERFKDLIKQSNEAAKSINFTDSKSIKDYEKSVRNAATAEAALLKVEQQKIKNQQENERLNQQQIKTQKEATNAANQATKQTQQQIAQQQKLAVQQAKTAAATQLQKDAYGKLNQEYIIAQRNAKNLAAEFGLESGAAIQAAASASILDKKLKDIDSSVGQSQRNVGNYFSGFSKLYGLLRTAANIIPGLGISGIILLGYDTLVGLVEKLSGAFELNTKAIDENHDALLKLREETEKSNKAAEAAIDRQLIAQGKISAADAKRFEILDKFQEDEAKAQKERDEQVIKRAKDLGIVLKRVDDKLVIDKKKTSLKNFENAAEFYRQVEGLDAVNFVASKARANAADEEIKAIQDESYKEQLDKQDKNVKQKSVKYRDEEKLLKEHLKEIVDAQNKSIKEIADNEDERFKERLKNTEENRQRELRALHEEEKNYEETEKDKQKTIENVEKEITQDLERTLSLRTQRRQEAADAQIRITERAIDIDARLAAGGYDNSLAADKAFLAKQELQKKQDLIRQAKIQEAIKLSELFISSVNNKVDAGYLYQQALPEALAEVGFSKGIATLISGSFKDGTENTGKVANALDSDGGRLAIIHDEERIMTKEQNKMIGDISNDELAQLAANRYLPNYMAGSGLIDDIKKSDQVNNVIIKTLQKELQGVKMAIQNKKELNVSWRGVDDRFDRLERSQENNINTLTIFVGKKAKL